MVTVPRLVQRMFPKRLWALPSKHTVYLTFDDGPVPEITPWVLDLLKKNNAKATFFCIGDNVQKHNEIFKRIISEGHATGNHTFHHLKGWNTITEAYLENFERCEKVMASVRNDAATEVKKDNYSNVGANLFRPPYGKMTSTQAKSLQKKGVIIVMWSLLSYDYENTISEEECFQNVVQNLKPGSIVVFHDSNKAERNLKYVLPKVLKLISEKGWNCGAIHNLE